MDVEVLNHFEESEISNRKLPVEWQNQESLDNLEEFLQQNWEQRSVFYDDGEISSRQQFLKFTSHGGIRTNNYIGTISFKGKQLNIFPKVFKESKHNNDTDLLDLKHMMRNLTQWIQYCNKFSYPFISISSELDYIDNLRELFVTLYLRYVKQTIDHGLYYRYEDRKEDLSIIRGHIDFKDYINCKLPNGQSYKFNCSYSEFEVDNLVNRIIKHVCRLLSNQTNSKENKNIIRYVLTKLNEVSDMPCKPAECDGIRLSKVHRQYSVILSMSKLFLLNKSSTYSLDVNESFCFLFPTEYLFEGFIGGFFKEILEGKADVRLQASDKKLFSDTRYAGESLGAAFLMRNDILVEHHEKGIFVLDTKYKETSRFEGNDNVKISAMNEITENDCRQLLEYADQRGLNDAYLLYPMFRFERNEPYDFEMIKETSSGKKVIVHAVRIPFVFEEDTKKTSDNLTKALLSIF